MPPYSRRLYDNLPVYARMADEELGLLAHICDAGIQPDLNKIYRAIQSQEYIYDPDHPASWNHLDWLGQFVGLGIVGKHWLGIGINPTWMIADKIDVIKRAFQYWQIKGSEPGVREAIAMWLRFDDEATRLLLNLPFGRQPTDNPPSWWGWGTSYDVHLNQAYPERQHFAWGNYWGQRHRENYFTLQSDWRWDYLEPWSDWVLNYVEAPEVTTDRSRLGDRELWMHFYLYEWEWNRIFPDIFELNPEILPVTTTATVFGWLQSYRQPNAVQMIQKKLDDATITEFDLDGFQWGQLTATSDWTLIDAAFSYGGTLWPYDVVPNYVTQETVSTDIEWGVWQPQFWDEQWWGPLITGYPTQGTLAISIVSLSAVETLNISTLSIDTTELNTVGLPGAELWYVPWGAYTETQKVTVTHSGVSCSSGISFKLSSEPDSLTISIGPNPLEISNQFLSPGPPEPGDFKLISGDEQEWFSIDSNYGYESPKDDGFIPGTVQQLAPDSTDDAFEDADVVPSYAIDFGFTPADVEPLFTVNGFDPALVSADEFEPALVRDIVSSDSYIPAFIISDIYPCFNDVPTIETLNFNVDTFPQCWEVPGSPVAGWVLEEPVVCATYNWQSVDDGYPWLSGLESILGDASAVGYPVDTFSIDTSDFVPVETMAATPVITGYLCNIFAGFSSLTPTNIRQDVTRSQDNRQLADIYPTLALASIGDNWKLLVETDEEIFFLSPVTMFWYRGDGSLPSEFETRSQVFSFDQGLTNLYLEFVLAPKLSTHIGSATLVLGTQIVQHQKFYYELNTPKPARIGLAFRVPFRLPSGLDTPEEEVLLEEILPFLTQELRRLGGLNPMPTYTNAGGTLIPDPATAESMKNVLLSLRNLLRDKKIGDAYFPYSIAIPSTSVQVEHGLDKYPSVTFVDTIDGAGSQIEGNVEYVDPNTILVTFSSPTTGRIFCN